MLIIRSAGVKDSALTIHGSLQAERLARHLAAIEVRLTRIFSSDLQRAYRTAEAIRLEQLKLKKDANFDLVVTELSILREQDFGFYEGKPFHAKPRELNRSNHRSEHQNSPGFKDVESKEAMAKRMNSFLEQFIVPCLQEIISEPEPVFVIVSHGMILSTLWKCFLKRSASQNVRLGNGLEMKSGSATIEHIGAWSNTGYMLLDVHLLAQSAPTARATAGNTAVEARQIKATIVHDLRIVIKAVNSKDHLRGLKRTGGGVGSSKFDEGQKKIESFFKKRRV